MRLAPDAQLLVRGGPFPGVVAQSLEHGESSLATRRLLSPEQALADQRVEPLQHIDPGRIWCRDGQRERLRRIEGKAPHEDAEPAEERLLGSIEQVVAPVDGC